MAIFAVLFGTRHIDATEHQDGLMLAIADRIDRQARRLRRRRRIRDVLDVRWAGCALRARAASGRTPPRSLTREPALGTIAAMTLLSLFAIVLLPRQFHVTVVENNNEAEIRRASWLFPLYLVLINLFVVPIALAGLLTFTARADRQRHVRAGAAARRAVRPVHHRGLCRRPFGRNRHGDRRIGRARHHGVERHRHAARPAATRGR